MAGNELATAYITLVPSLKGAQASIQRQLGGIDTTAAGRQMGEKATGGFAGGFNIKGAAVASAALAGVAAAASFVGTMSDALWEYADYEQLVGGVDTLFKESSGKLQEYAADAYKTAGLSANEYMEQSTSFAASLIQSLGGDTEAAADYANRAITDMADNANKMGTDMMMIQNAYQGFAKQNYTMLDNLKLGYGGTQEEMKRLLADATALTGIEYDMSSYADIVDAIHVIQEEMGITGTTAAEASETISGSIASAQSAWSNWLTSLGNENANMAEQTAILVETIATAASNIVPRIGAIMESLGTTLMAELPNVLNNLTTYVSENAGAMAQVGLDFFGQLIVALAQIATTLAANFILMLSGLLETIGQHVADFLIKGIEMMAGIAEGIAEGGARVLVAIGEAIEGAAQSVADFVGEFIQAGKNLISGIVQGITDAAGAVWEAIKNICSNALGAIKDFFGIASPSKVMREMFGYVGEGMALGLADSEGVVNDAMKHLVTGAESVASSFNPTMSATLAPYGFSSGGNNINVYIEGRTLADINAIDQFVEMLELEAGVNPA